jgi:predicted PurR-regulated permease PerM
MRIRRVARSPWPHVLAVAGDTMNIVFPDPPHRQVVSNVVLLVALVLLMVVLWPLWQPLLFAAILGSVLWPLQKRLRARLWDRRYLSAALLTVGVVALILTPLTIIGIIAVRQAIETTAWVRGALARGGIHELLRPLPDNIERWLSAVFDRVPKPIKMLPPPAEAGRWAALQIQNVVSTVSAFAFDLAMMLIALFFLLSDGNQLVDWIKRVSPLGPGRTAELLAEFRGVARSSIGANFATGLLQSGVATIGYELCHVPQPLFFGLLTLLTSFIPSVGTSIISLPLAGLLLLLGHPWAALFLALWGLLFVGTVDNLVRPLLIKGDINVHGALVFFAIIGGIGGFGLVGVVVGPMAVVLFLTMVRFYRRDVRQTLAANDTGPPASPSTEAPAPPAPAAPGAPSDLRVPRRP